MADRVLVTGVSGFLGGHVALQLLEAGHIVRGTVRDPRKADTVRQMLKDAGGDVSRLEFAAVDLLSDDGWADAMRDVRFLQHVASPFLIRMPKDKMDLIRPAVDGTRRALEAGFAAKVERVVLTSSTAAILYGHGATGKTSYTAADWTDVGGDGVNGYTESKTLAERAAWETADKHKRRQDLAVVNPGMIFGPLLDDDPGTSVTLLQRMMNGGLPAIPQMSFVTTDVRDVAAVHVAAMTAPDAGGRRIPVGNGTYGLWDIATLLRPMFPEKTGKIPKLKAPNWLVRMLALFDKDIRDNVGNLGIEKRVDASAAKALLGRPFVPIDMTLRDTVRSLIDRRLI